MFQKRWISLLIFFLTLTATAQAADPKAMSACLPDAIGVFTAAAPATITPHKENVVSVSRPYQFKNKQKSAIVSVWKIPGNKQIWPYIGGQEQAEMTIVAGRLCILKHDPVTMQSTLVVNIDKGYISPPPFLYRVCISTTGKTSDETAKALAEALHFDRLFALYDQ